MHTIYTIRIKSRLITILLVTLWLAVLLLFDDQTYPFVDINLKCVIVEWKEVCVRDASCIAFSILQPEKNNTLSNKFTVV